jgi:anion transporter
MDGKVIGARKVSAATFLSALVIGSALAMYFAPPPMGVSVEMMHAAALVLFTIGLWATGWLPEHVVGLLFFVLAMALAVAPAQVVFSGFTSAALWLVLGGLVMAEAVNRTGLAQRLAAALFDRYALSYAQLVVAVVMASVVLTFLVPSTVGRVLLLVPIVIALAQRVGFERDSAGYNGLCLAAIVATFQSGTGVLPSIVANMVLAGSAETLYGVQITYAEYLWAQFPVMGALKSLALVGLVLWLFPATARAQPAALEQPPLTAEQRRTAVILVVALALWATDFLHGIQAGWVALGAGVACLLPRVGVMPAAAFNDVKLGPYFYIGATIGLGLVIQKSGLSDGLGGFLHGVLSLEPGADFANFLKLSVLTTITGLFTTIPAQPAVLAPLAENFAQATGWPLKTALMVIAVGYSTFLAPYQVPPVMVGLQIGALRTAPTLKLVLSLALFGLLVMVPLQYLWWRAIGYLGQ